eukprot:TRINITY_DN74485_c0_g1_i1.p1 TRINITY_DN74485_c0_g1~~TRINITY_DN74485_c0_g1_i1.p1  ORF type:complete len:493 (-),score=88.40 TRINITY_DN74485_c0_g1_i1:420-1898(-)
MTLPQSEAEELQNFLEHGRPNVSISRKWKLCSGAAAACSLLALLGIAFSDAKPPSTASPAAPPLTQLASSTDTACVELAEAMQQVCTENSGATQDPCVPGACQDAFSKLKDACSSDEAIHPFLAFGESDCSSMSKASPAVVTPPVAVPSVKCHCCGKETEPDAVHGCPACKCAADQKPLPVPQPPQPKILKAWMTCAECVKDGRAWQPGHCLPSNSCHGPDMIMDAACYTDKAGCDQEKLQDEHSKLCPNHKDCKSCTGDGSHLCAWDIHSETCFMAAHIWGAIPTISRHPDDCLALAPVPVLHPGSAVAPAVEGVAGNHTGTLQAPVQLVPRPQAATPVLDPVLGGSPQHPPPPPLTAPVPPPPAPTSRAHPTTAAPGAPVVQPVVGGSASMPPQHEQLAGGLAGAHGLDAESRNIWEQVLALDKAPEKNGQVVKLAALGLPDTVATQVVSGMNYVFKWKGGAEVTVWSQPWMHHLEVTDMKELPAAALSD